MYKKFGENKKDLIVLDIIMKESDTKEIILDAYLKNAGITPIFPIVLYNDGAYDLSEVTGTPGQSRPTWIIHPNRTLEKTSYFEPAMSDDVEAALNDDCDHTDLVHSHTASKNFIQSFSLSKKQLRFTLLQEGKCTVRLCTPGGKVVYQTNKYFTTGENSLNLNSKELSQGMYALTISDKHGKLFTSLVSIK